MSTGQSSARPADLAAFVATAQDITTDLQGRIARRRASYDEFQASGSITVANAGLLDGSLPALVGHQRDNATFVDLVREAFLDADTGGASSDVVTVADASLARAFDGAAQARALDPRSFDGVSAPITVTPATVGAIPQDSGFVDDPVCTATGHFVELQDDFAMPPALRVLTWTRTYSSRLLEPGAFGRGWWSWADVRCEHRDGTVVHRGPDGRRLEWRRADDGSWPQVPHLGVELYVGGDAVELRWSITSAVGEQVWRFDRTGALVSVVGPAIGRTTFSHRADGEGVSRLHAVEHDGGRSLAVEWEGGRIARVVSSDGRAATYAYDDRGDLASVDAAGGATQFVADDRGRIVSVTDADDVRLCHNTYDDLDRVVRQVSPLGRETELRYLSDALTRIADDHGGPVSLFEHDHLGRVVGVVDEHGRRFARRFDEQGRVVAQRTFTGATFEIEDDLAAATDVSVAALPDGTTERWERDGLGRVVRHERGAGRWTAFDYVGDDQRPVRLSGPLDWELRIEWERGRPAVITDADGVVVSFRHDDDGALRGIRRGTGAEAVDIEVDVHRSGNVAALRWPDGIEVGFDWDDAGRLLGLRDPEGHRTVIERTAAGRVAALVDPLGARLALDHGSHGLVDRITDALGASVTYQHDPLGQVTGMVNADGSKWQLTYGTLGLLTMLHAPDGAVMTVDHDADGFVRAVTDPLGLVHEWERDPTGRIQAEIEPGGARTRYERDAVANVVARIDAAGGRTSYEWDALDRLVGWHDADGVGAQIRYTRAGRVEARRGADGTDEVLRYDTLGRVVAVERDGARWAYEYDVRDAVVAEVAPSGRRTEWVRDGSGRVVATTIGAATWRTRYDACGRVVAHEDPLGSTTRYEWDANGRLVGIVDAANVRTGLRYDECGRVVATIDAFGREVRTERDVMGRPSVQTDQLGRSTRWRYDAAGRLVGIHRPDGSNIERELDAAGRLRDLLLDGVTELAVDRDGVGRALAVHEPAAARTQHLDWTPGGRLAAWTDGERSLRWRHEAGQAVERTDQRGASVERRWRAGRIVAVSTGATGELAIEHDADGRMVAIEGPLGRREWRHDDAGQLIGHADRPASAPARETSLRRDRVGRVIEVVTPEGTTTYAYDLVGQLTTATDATATRTFTYDRGGRLVAEAHAGSVRSYRYDDAHQLAAIDDGGRTTVLTYDGAGRRIAQTGPAGERTWRWDGLDRLRALTTDGTDRTLDVDGMGALRCVDETDLVWDPSGPVAQLVRIGSTDLVRVGDEVVAGIDDEGRSSWIAADWRGSVTAAPGVADPWGRAARPGPGVGLGMRGELTIDGQVWLRARVYDPDTASFLTVDPVAPSPGAPAASFPYAFVGNDPINFADPTGLTRALTVDQFNTMRERATEVQWGNIATVAVGVVGAVVIVAMMPASALALAGASAAFGAVGGATPELVDSLVHGEAPDWGVVAKGAIVGGVFGGVTGGASKFLPPSLTQTLVGNVGTNAISGGATAAGSELWDVTGLPGSDHDFNWGAVVAGTGSGAVAGAGAHVYGTLRPTPVPTPSPVPDPAPAPVPVADPTPPVPPARPPAGPTPPALPPPAPVSPPRILVPEAPAGWVRRPSGILVPGYAANY